MLHLNCNALSQSESSNFFMYIIISVNPLCVSKLNKLVFNQRIPGGNQRIPWGKVIKCKESMQYEIINNKNNRPPALFFIEIRTRNMWVFITWPYRISLNWGADILLACVAADSFPFSQAARRSNKRTKSGRAKEHAWSVASPPPPPPPNAYFATLSQFSLPFASVWKRKGNGCYAS